MGILNTISGQAVLILGFLMLCITGGLYYASLSTKMELLLLFTGLSGMIANFILAAGCGLTAYQKNYSPLASIFWLLGGLFCCFAPIAVLFIPDKEL